MTPAQPHGTLPGNPTMTTTPAEFAKALLRDLVGAFTKRPDQLRVNAADMTGAVVISLETGDHNDYRKIVGTAGKNIKALQIIMAMHGAKVSRRINLTLIEFSGADAPRETYQWIRDPDWDARPTVALIRRVMDACLPVSWQLNVVRTGPLTTMEVIPQAWCEVCGRPEFPLALHGIFHAIGKTGGADVHVQFAKAGVPA